MVNWEATLMPIALSEGSPLRYPGGKASLLNYIAKLLDENKLCGCHFIEPYAGSAIISLQLLRKEVILAATIVEKDPLIYAFWQCVFNYTEAFIKEIEKLPVTIDTWHEFQKYREADGIDDFSILEMGLAGLFYNRTNFSGIMKANPLGGLKQESSYKIDCRFNKIRLIKQIEQLSELRLKISVVYDDALEYLKKQHIYLKTNNCFIYIDPPYYEKGKILYRYWYDQEDHKDLAKFLIKCKTPWLVSYDNHEEIHKIYRKAKTVEEMFFDYTVSKRRKEKELLISNLEIPPGMKAIYQAAFA